MERVMSIRADFLAAGSGPLVVLVHSSMAGARQWAALTEALMLRYTVRAVNLFGYGGTPPWPGMLSPSLDDYAELVCQLVPDTADDIAVVGHSFGGAVAMQVAARLRGRVSRLALFEPSIFALLDACGRPAAFDEIATLAAYTRLCITEGRADVAAEAFIDYWCGEGTWEGHTPERRAGFTRAILGVEHEWCAVLNAAVARDWVAQMPRRTLVMASAMTKAPSRELVELLLQLRPDWMSASICRGGHMAPLTHPHLVNPIVQRFLAR